ncbi:MAG: dicarboxylate/amino acid:cation symporter [Oceanicaulis sp.]|uniref:dicarboxylate/amino acid:cation symporter n=1 Tax=Glycocaulis sp. TaxID=1969725 RepID=UPI0025C4E45B|nr:dicarboxylate/amino acid:cation symporter [Glycocaulis sp.]MCC5981670.1 dicarboxylate/amino acid:cation symporter [Oceanicaulis sp.]MCH8520504.1 dicarboxylate/amino acid:cation symporter [Glycocaulis sp.]
MSETMRRRAQYRRLAYRMESWMRTRLWAQVMAGLVLGVFAGLLLGPEADLIPRDTAELIGGWLALPGSIFLSLIKMVLMPLVLSSIVLGLAASASDPAGLRASGTRLAGFVGVTTLAAALLGATLGLTIAPGTLIDSATAEAVAGDAPLVADVTDEAPANNDRLGEIIQTAPDLIVGLVPDNPLASAVQNEMLAIVIFGLFLGAAYVSSTNKTRLDPLLGVFEGLLEVSMTVVRWAMYITPYAVFGLTAQLLARLGVGSLAALGAYVGTVLIGLALLLVLYLVLVALLGRMNPLKFQSAVGEAQLLAFSTSSSAAVMPLSIRIAVEKLGVPPSMASFIIPLAATVNMAGTALYQAVAVIFVAQVAGVTLAPGEIAIIVLTLVASSIGAPGAPGVSIAILSGLIASFGIPPAGLVFVLGVDRFLDMARTSVNVTGDLVATRILAVSTHRKEED